MTGSARLRVGVTFVVVASVLAISACVRDGSPVPATLLPAPTDVQDELVALVRAENRILFDAIVSGDPSRYPTVKMHPDYEDSFSLYGDEARATLATLSGGPISAAQPDSEGIDAAPPFSLAAEG